MTGQIILVVCTLGISYVSFRLVQWYRHYQTAQQCGWPVYVSPVRFYDPLWVLSAPILVPVIKLLPDAWTKPWLSISRMFEIWKAGYKPFEEAGSDTFVLATPSGNILWTSDGVIIQQLLAAHPKCQLATSLVEIFKSFGPNVGVTEGEEWRLYRRMITSGLGNSTNTRAWRESQDQTVSMLKEWTQSEDGVIEHVTAWTSKLALHVLVNELFDVKMTWRDNVKHSVQNDSGDRLTFEQALRTTIQNLSTILLTPKWLLGLLPLRGVQKAALAFKETNLYLDEMRERADSQIESLVSKKNKSLLEAIVVAGADPSITGKSAVSKESIKGNLFFSLLAGHHTCGSIMGIIFIMLAVYPDAQRRLQAQLDRHFGHRPKGDWSVENDFKKLQSGFLGAVQKETSALYHPVQFIPRIAAETFTIFDGSEQPHVIPAGILTMINMPAAAQNPTIWPKQPRDDDINIKGRARLSCSPAFYFNPERWLFPTDDGSGEEVVPDERESTTWFTYSQGPRACPGRAMAQIEMTAVMATFFKDHTLELVVSDKTIIRCGGDLQRAQRQTREDTIKMMYDAIDPLMSGKTTYDLPMRVVPRVRA